MSLGGNVRGIELVERTPRKQLAGECHPRWWLFCLGFAVGRFWGLWCILFCGVGWFFHLLLSSLLFPGHNSIN